MENEIKTNERQQAQALGLLNAKDVVVSVVKVTADGVSIKLWPDADAVRGVLGEVAQLAQVPGGYSLRRYVCGRALYCAVQLGDATRDAPCPAGYHVHSDANLNEADGSLIAASAEWGIGKGVFDLPPMRISEGKVHIVPKAKDGTNVIAMAAASTAATGLASTRADSPETDPGKTPSTNVLKKNKHFME